ncbi:MAG: hypothetical protein HWN65_12235 [Candidatus Helarchaeota archaeon]|nr:hypothetical protein [Candidatus Helarchaeota archaeon]
MGTLRIIGGIIALVAASLILTATVLWTIVALQGASVYNITAIVMNYVLAVLVIIGCILGFKGKNSGGILVLIIGVVSIIFGILYVGILDPWTSMFQQMAITPLVLVIPYVTLEQILVVLGGILILAGGSD